MGRRLARNSGLGVPATGAAHLLPSYREQCRSLTRTPPQHTSPPYPRQPCGDKCPLPPVGRAGAKSGLQEGEDVAGRSM